MKDYLTRKYGQHKGERIFDEYYKSKVYSLIIQAFGRGRRGNTDYCSVILVDSRYELNEKELDVVIRGNISHTNSNEIKDFLSK